MSFLAPIIPITYWFELWVVLPEVFRAGSLMYYGHLALGSFIMYNIVGNWVFVMLTDTSMKNIIVKQPPLKTEIGFVSRDKWRFCAVCESIQPPRTWHCITCGTCIIKRDHHCLFTGCCIGHTNQRFFIIMVLYLCLATTYASFYNNYFIWIRHGQEYRNAMSLLKMVFPLAWFVYDMSLSQYYFLIYTVNLLGSLFTGALLFYHGQNMFRGVLAYEANNGKKEKVEYNQGWRKNVQMVLGENWVWTLVNPFSISELPHDGMSWDELATNKSS